MHISNNTKHIYQTQRGKKRGEHREQEKVEKTQTEEGKETKKGKLKDGQDRTPLIPPPWRKHTTVVTSDNTHTQVIGAHRDCFHILAATVVVNMQSWVVQYVWPSVSMLGPLLAVSCYWWGSWICGPFTGPDVTLDTVTGSVNTGACLCPGACPCNTYHCCSWKQRSGHEGMGNVYIESHWIGPLHLSVYRSAGVQLIHMFMYFKKTLCSNFKSESIRYEVKIQWAQQIFFKVYFQSENALPIISIYFK